MLLIGINVIMMILLHLVLIFDYFYKTSSSENIEFVQDVFKKLNDAGHIYQKEIIQFYCNNDKKIPS